MTRQQRRAAERENPYWPAKLARLSLESLKSEVPQEQHKPEPLGPHFVPAFVNVYEAELGPRGAARARLDHWRAMIARSRGMCGFRLDPGTGSKRKRPRNPRPGQVAMILNGLMVQARYAQ